jgi:hypothetical protein
MKEIKSKKEHILAHAFCASIQFPLRRMAHVATNHSSQFIPPHNPASGASNPTPVATIQSARGFSH